MLFECAIIPVAVCNSFFGNKPLPNPNFAEITQGVKITSSILPPTFRPGILRWLPILTREFYMLLFGYRSSIWVVAGSRPK